MGTDYYIVGVLSVDRPKRELRVWVCRTYDDADLPQTYCFFAGILHDMFDDSGLGNMQTERWAFSSSEYSEKPLLPRVTAIAEAAVKAEKAAANQKEGEENDDDDSYFDAAEFLGFDCETPEDPSPFIERVEMIRWSDGPKLDLQAEYLVRLTDDKYLSCRADPCFLGRLFFSSRHSDDYAGEGTPTIPLGPKQDAPIYPPADFTVDFAEAAACRDYHARNLTTFDRLLDEAVPKLVAQDPTVFTPDVFLRLRNDIQRQILCVLAFARRRSARDENDDGSGTPRRRSKRLRRKQDAANPFALLHDESIFWHIFSFLPLVDKNRLNDVRQVYLGLKYGKVKTPLQRPDLCYRDFDLLDCEDQAALKHFGMRQIVVKLNDLCQAQHYEVNQIADEKEKERAAAAYLERLKRVAQAIEVHGKSSGSGTCFGLVDPRLTPLPKQPLEWIPEHVQAALQYDTMREVIEKVFSVPPHQDT